MLIVSSISSYDAINLCDTSIVIINDLPLLINRHTTTAIAKTYTQAHTLAFQCPTIHTQWCFEFISIFALFSLSLSLKLTSTSFSCNRFFFVSIVVKQKQ